MSRLYKNIVYNLMGQGLLLVLGFVSVKFIFKHLGEDALGIIYFTVMMNAMVRAVLEMGFSAAVVREVSANFGSKPKYIRNLVRTFSLIYWGIYAVVGVAIFCLAPVIVKNWINLRTIEPATAIYVLRILGISSLVALPNSFYVSLFRGLQRMEFNNSIDVITNALQQIGAILMLALGGNLFHVVHWFAACYIFRICIYIAVSSHFFTLRALIPGYSREVVRENFGFAAKMMSISIIATIHTHIDKVIISILAPIAIVGYYGVAYTSVSKGQLFTGAVSQAAFPSFSALFKAGARAELLLQYRKLQDLVCFGIVLIFAAIPFALMPLFTYIINQDAARLLLLPTTLLCIGFYLNGTIIVPYVFSLAVGKPEIAVRQNFYALFVVLPLTVYLIYFFGLTGAGISWVFYHLFYYTYAIPKMCRECMKISVAKWYLHVAKIFLLITFTYGIAWAIQYLTDSYSIVALTSAYIVASIFFIIGSYFMIGKELQETLLRYFSIVRAKIVEFA